MPEQSGRGQQIVAAKSGFLSRAGPSEVGFEGLRNTLPFSVFDTVHLQIHFKSTNPWNYNFNRLGGTAMTSEVQQHMLQLCRQIEAEQDQHKFLRLVEELNDLLEGKAQRLEQKLPLALDTKI
jgi:hypothetical protein